MCRAAFSSSGGAKEGRVKYSARMREDREGPAAPAEKS
jgi:hypothetical protein